MRQRDKERIQKLSETSKPLTIEEEKKIIAIIEKSVKDYKNTDSDAENIKRQTEQKAIALRSL